jgi:hypothetical protein
MFPAHMVNATTRLAAHLAGLALARRFFRFLSDMDLLLMTSHVGAPCESALALWAGEYVSIVIVSLEMLFDVPPTSTVQGFVTGRTDIDGTHELSRTPTGPSPPLRGPGGRRWNHVQLMMRGIWGRERVEVDERRFWAQSPLWVGVKTRVI